jgi:FAD dependent oxidoreductase
MVFSCLLRQCGGSLWVSLLTLSVGSGPGLAQNLVQDLPVSRSQSPRTQTLDCDLLIAGGGLAGVAAAIAALDAGHTVCLTELTDWVGGQLSSQGTTALDEARQQRSQLFYPTGYLDLRRRIQAKYGELNPGDCWVSYACFLPKDAHAILWDMLQASQHQGRGQLHWLPSTVIKDLQISADGQQIEGAIALQHTPAAGTPPLNTEPLSHIVEDAYRYADSDRLQKTVLKLRPKERGGQRRWLVIDATETGELVALADVPYRLGLDPRSPRDPSSASESGDAFCTQGFTYTFAFEQTAAPQPQVMPPFYPQYVPYYGFDANPAIANFNAVFTYRRIWSARPRSLQRVPAVGSSLPKPGDISMQNWVWGNDYRPGTAADNLIYSREQLQQRGELTPGGWRGGLRTETLRRGEELALGFYYWLVAGTTNSQPAGQKTPQLNHRLLQGLDSPMGTRHGLSKYPYIRESRRIIGRPSYGYANGFTLDEVDISKADYRQPIYRTNLSPTDYRQLWLGLAGLQTTAAIINGTAPDQIGRRSRSRIYPDSVGIAQYAIDFHPCMAAAPPERPGNTERPGTRLGHGQAYPAQIPLRALIPQRLDNLLVAGKSIATSHITAAAYRVHSFEWSVGIAAGTTASFALREGVLPYQLVGDVLRPAPLLAKLQQQLAQSGNPTAFPNTTILNEQWQDWRVW